MSQEAGVSIWGWGGLGVVLFLVTFGPFAIFYFAFYILCFLGGGFAVTLLFGKINSEKYLEKCEHTFLPAAPTGVPKALEEMKRESRQIKIDRRLTGSSIIDEPLQQVIQFALRDYIQYWYYTLSDDESFLLEVRKTIQNALVQFATSKIMEFIINNQFEDYLNENNKPTWVQKWLTLCILKEHSKWTFESSACSSFHVTSSSTYYMKTDAKCTFNIFAMSSAFT
ncbi:sorting nexin-13-like [Heterodontus francisci]|uniref:sorting nexin-13-like n=1 Tax=Heterodontus francisci TaxID=7792 RepID=UPI00355C4834